MITPAVDPPTGRGLARRDPHRRPDDRTRRPTGPPADPADRLTPPTG
ncbi:hypothetical protein [Alloactinosynnema sp. L-07]|nr:hypothetical protein [Alloactinosynnema sp. L-07]